MKDNLKDTLNEEYDKEKMDHFLTYVLSIGCHVMNLLKQWNIHDYVGNKNTLKHTYK